VSYGTFVGVQVLHRSIFDVMHGEAFSIIDTYAELIAAGETIHVHDAADQYWSDLGTPETLTAGRRVFAVLQSATGQLDEPVQRVTSVFEGAGSTQVTRVQSSRRSVVGVTSPDKPAMNDLIRLTKMLTEHGAPVPAVLDRTPSGAVMEDGGRQLLEVVEHGGETNEIWREAAHVLCRLAEVPVSAFIELRHGEPPVFDRENVLFDLRYFNRHALAADESSALRWSETTCSRTAEIVWSWFADQPQVLMHRDFQSTNLLIDTAGILRMVDLGTLRLGFSLYDLASLAFDIYLPHREHRLELLWSTYAQRFPGADRRVFWGAAWLRLIQATATACRFAPERPFFRQALPNCIAKLQRVISEPEAHPLLNLLPKEITERLSQLVASGFSDRS